MNAMTRENRAQSSSVRALRMASMSQLKISHARYGYLYSRLGSASAGGGSTRYETSFSTTGRVLRLRWVKVEATGQLTGFDRYMAGDAG